MYKVPIEVLEECRKHLQHFVVFIEDELHNLNENQELFAKIAASREEVKALINLLDINYLSTGNE